MTTSGYRLTGLSVARTDGPIQTFDQLGGGGTVVNNALAIPGHLGGAWNSLEYVLVSPVQDGVSSSVGEHVQGTDEIYFIHRGKGVLTTNDVPTPVAARFLVIAVAPGMTRTPLVETLMEGYAREFQTDTRTAEMLELQRRGIPLGRLGEPEEVAAAVLYLATSPFCNGTILNISGGNVRAVMC